MFLKDLFDGALLVPAKSYKDQIGWMKRRWTTGNPDKWTEDKIVTDMLRHYTNLESEGTWAKELAENEQVIALASKIEVLEQKLAAAEKRTVALGTDAKPSATAPSADPNANRRSQKQPYTVKPWRLEFKGNTVDKNGTTYHWCTGDHWSAGIKYNGMYCTHKTEEHDAWRKQQDESRKRRFEGTNRTSNTQSGGNDDAKKKKLALSESLRTTLCTQVGVSSEVADRIWAEACRDSGNE